MGEMQMNYLDGQSALLGDKVTLDGQPGVVVFSVDDGQYAPEFPEAQWGYLGKGVMCKFDVSGLIHFTDAYSEEDLVLVARA